MKTKAIKPMTVYAVYGRSGVCRGLFRTKAEAWDEALDWNPDVDLGSKQSIRAAINRMKRDGWRVVKGTWSPTEGK